MKLWFPEVDLLKATAIILIVFCHIDNYVSCYNLIRIFDGYAALIGLSIFFFISGFLLYQSDSVINSIEDIKKFYKKKFIRIYPIYWVALASLVVIFGILQVNPGHVENPYNLNPLNLLLHFIGLQGIFPHNTIQSMWFVGVIVLFYLLYPIIVYLPKNLFEMFAVSSIMLFLLVTLHFFFGLFDINALTYFPIFISGIFMNKIVYSSKNRGNDTLFKQILFSNMILISAIFLVLVLRKVYQLNFQFLPDILSICAMISFCIIYLIFTHLFVNIRRHILLILSPVGIATYAIYLFHHQFLAVFMLLTDVFIQKGIFQDVLVLTFGVAGAIVCGIIIQKIEQYIFMRYKTAHQP